ncbi:MAG: YkgJ family cysteine cluster protein, partial [Myxococcales bacterium]|nr:YkgJ family cysteine cluster protein [Myxococcales bacterium]
AIDELLAEVAGRGLLADGIAPSHPDLERQARPGVSAPERPLEPLPDYHFRCDGNGGCCTTYASIPFTGDERRRAQGMVPEAAQAPRFFLPLFGSADSELSSVTLVNGACAFLSEGRCGLHREAGADAKPRGCRTYPATFVDDGTAVRVSVGVECACALTSLDSSEGAPLVAGNTAADLPWGIRVVELPTAVPVAGDRVAPRGELRRFTASLLAALPADIDALAVLWRLAASVERAGLDVEAALQGLAEAEPPAAGAFTLRALAFGTAARDKQKSAEEWRSEQDRTVILARWMGDTARALEEPARVAAALEPRSSAAERFYLRSILHGYQLRISHGTVAQGLADRAFRLLVARVAAEVPRGADPSRDQPIAAVEAAMRGLGLDDYASGLG